MKYTQKLFSKYGWLSMAFGVVMNFGSLTDPIFADAKTSATTIVGSDLRRLSDLRDCLNALDTLWRSLESLSRQSSYDIHNICCNFVQDQWDSFNRLCPQDGVYWSYKRQSVADRLALYCANIYCE